MYNRAMPKGITDSTVKRGPKPIPDADCEEALRRMETDGEGPYAIAADMGWEGKSLIRAIRRDPARAARYWAAHAAAAEDARQEADALTDGLMRLAHARAAWEVMTPEQQAQAVANGMPIPPAVDGLVRPAEMRRNHLVWEAERRDPARFGQRQQVSVSGGMTVSKGPDLSTLSVAQLEALAAIQDIPSDNSPTV